jgi:CAAX protease family protein
MSLSGIFFNKVGRLRSGWRLLIFAALFYFLQLLFGGVIRVLYALILNFAPALLPRPAIQDLIFRLLLLTSALGAGYACTRLLEALPWRSLGLTFHRKWFQHLLVGSALGVATLILAAGIAYAAGGLHFSLAPPHMAYSVGRTLLVSAVIFVIAALAEESLFRGYPLQTLTRAQLAWLGVLLTSIPFALAHLGNPNATIFGAINTGLAGVWLAFAYLRSRSLWFPLGVHWAWNWALGAVFGLPVSGLSLARHPVLIATDLGPDWLTGGRYGIEGGIACTVALLLSSVFIWSTRFITPAGDLLKLTSQENPVPVTDVQPAAESAPISANPLSIFSYDQPRVPNERDN